MRNAIVYGEPDIDRKKLAAFLSALDPSAFFLDFETVKTSIPLFPGTTPHEQIVTQYSIHVCNSPAMKDLDSGIVQWVGEYRRDKGGNLLMIHATTKYEEDSVHRAYLADPSRDCRRELAESLLEDLDGAGHIVVYSSFEKRC